LYLFLQIEILGGLFQTTFILFFDELPNFLWTQLLKTSHQYSNTSLSFMSILLNPLRKENISNNNNLFDEGDSLELSNNKDLDIIFKTWLVTNKLVKEYLNSKEFKTLIYKENSKCSGIYLWLNNKNGKYYIGSAKDFRNRLVRYYSPKELAITNNLIHRVIIKHKHENFSLYILEYYDLDNLITREQFYIDFLTPPYNILKVAGNSTGFKYSIETKEFMSEIKINDSNLLERIKGLSVINRGSTKSEKFKALRSSLTKGEKNLMFGKIHSSETQILMGSKKRGIFLSEAHKAKIREFLVKLGLIVTKSAKEVYLYSNNNLTVLFKKFRTYTETGLYLNCHRKTIYRYIDSNILYQDKWIVSSKKIL
jgi:group I intron endonuclease